MGVVYLLVFIILIFLHCQHFVYKPTQISTPTSCVCRNHQNQPVDWFIVYKLPRLPHSTNAFIANGTGYVYLDSSSLINEWHLSSQSINSSQSITGLTLATLYESNDHSFMFYNDQPPNLPISLIYGHSKGILAFEEITNSGFWLIHSVPHFPPVINRGYTYPDTGRIYGQTILCVSLNTSPTTRNNTIDFLSDHFLYTRPFVFDSRLTESATIRYATLSDGIIKNKAHISKPPFTRSSILEAYSLNLTIFSKYGSANMDMLSELITPTLQTPMLSETWSNGRQMNLPSNCSGLFHTENIEQLAWNFTVHHDHSKWLVADETDWICIGDMNRQAEQKPRHGGFACIKDRQIQQRFRNLVSIIEPCPKMK